MKRRQLAVDAAATVPIPKLPGELINEPAFRRELDLVRRAEQRFRDGGTDVRAHLGSGVTHWALIDWLDQSDSLADEMPGRKDLRRQRRRGILRILEGKDLGMPLDPPPQTGTPPIPWRNAEWWILALKDELEWLEMPVIPSSDSAMKIRPVVDVLTRRQARAILGWWASTLDYHIAIGAHLIGGLRIAEIPPVELVQGRVTRPRRTLHRIDFETVSFLAWVAARNN